MKRMTRMKYFKPVERYAGNWSALEEKNRDWEDMYRQRWSHDKVVRTTHGVNCTGSCSWKVFVKNGVITWENQQIDYPSCGPDMPEFEPRGCPRGASFSWYEYSPLRVKYPYMRGKLWTLWQEAMQEHQEDPIEAWKSIVENPEKAKEYKSARGKGGHVRMDWQQVTKIIAAQLIYTIKKYGPDRVAGFTPIPAKSMVSYASGARFLSLLGGEMLSFYDWYADLPPSSPQIWGEQTDVPESSDWFNAGYIIMWGSNVPLTRTPDAHFLTEVRYRGTKVVSVAPDYAESVTHADDWISSNPGSDAAVAQAMTHVILDEFYEQRQEEMFINYAKQYTDLPFYIMLEEHEDTYKAGRFLRASDIGKEEQHADWKPIIYDQNAGEFIVPNGTMGQRWEDDVKWNLILENEDGTVIDPAMSVLDEESKWEEIVYPFFDHSGNGTFTRSIPVKEMQLADGSVKKIATIYDVMLSQYGVKRHGATHTAENYLDKDSIYTPGWQQAITSVKPELVIQIAREFAQNAIDTDGRSMIIMGAGINHWFNSDTIYRSILNLVMLTGSEGKNGGGWAHYVGQEKVRPIEGWNNIAFARDWQGPPRLQNATSFFYFATDQWRYEEAGVDSLRAATSRERRYEHPADYNVLAARLGWMPAYPQFNKNSLAFAEEAKERGDDSDEAIVNRVVSDLQSEALEFAMEDPDAPENFPRTLFVWRSNLVSSSAKGQEYFMKHLFGATSNLFAEANEDLKPEEVKWREEVQGKLDLLLAIDFRMTTTPIYADIVLPAATWYEKEDLSSTDMHPFVHPFNRAIDPPWQTRSDWDIYRSIAEQFSEMAKTHLPGVYKDVVTTPLGHDSPQEIAQPMGRVQDWKKGEVDPVPGKTMPAMQVVERDYTALYDKYITLGPNMENGKIGAHGVSFNVKEQYDLLKGINGVYYDESIKHERPKLRTGKQVAEAILAVSSASNGRVSQKAFEAQEEITGVPLKEISADRSAERFTFDSITIQPREVIPTPVFSGSNKLGRRYSPFTTNIENLIPFRTLTGRQHFYLDHELFLDYGEALPIYKPTLPPLVLGPRDRKVKGGQDTLVLRYLTPHGKWNIHTTYQDNQYMMTLFRGGPTVWVSDEDASEHDLEDNDWVEVYNRNGVVAARLVVSHRMPKGTMFMYHAQDKHVHVPGSELTETRAGSHNAPTRIHMKPTQMVGGYAQLSYGFNYYGPIGNQRDEYVAVRKKKEVDWLEN